MLYALSGNLLLRESAAAPSLASAQVCVSSRSRGSSRGKLRGSQCGHGGGIDHPYYQGQLPHGAATTQTLFQSEEMGRPLLFLFKRLQVLRDEERDNAITGTDVSSAMNMMDGLSLLFCKSDASIELLWAIPGVTTFLLNLELSSVTMQKRKLVAAVPSDDELRNSDGDESICFHIFTKTMLRFMEACYVVIKAGLCCRENALASCAARMLMQWYGDPYIRGSFPAGPSESPSVLVFQDPCIRNSFPGGPLESPRVLFSQRLFFACWIFSPMIRWTRRRSSLA
jgi:hypothetical protein